MVSDGIRSGSCFGCRLILHRADLGCKDDNCDDDVGTALAAAAAAAAAVVVVVVGGGGVVDDDDDDYYYYYGGDHDDAVADDADDDDENVAGDVGLTSLVCHRSFDHCGNPVRCVAVCSLCFQHVPSLP